MSKHTDNAHLGAKLALRRHFLSRFHSEKPPRVLDCFQGSGVIWSRLRGEFAIGGYWGVDLKPKKGRLKIESSRILEQHGWNQNVVDLDAYGSPWGHWLHLLRTCDHDVTVFLTFGIVSMHGFKLDAAMNSMLGTHFNRVAIPCSMGRRVAEIAVPYCLRAAESYGFEVVEAAEGFPQKNARYLGVHLRRLQTQAQVSSGNSVVQVVDGR